MLYHVMRPDHNPALLSQYDPAKGSFIDVDNFLVGNSVWGMNLYAYCVNNLVNLADPSGLAASIGHIFVHAMSLAALVWCLLSRTEIALMLVCARLRHVADIQ